MTLRPRPVFLASAALTAVMWALFTLYDPYVPVAPSLTPGGGFEEEASEWTGWGPMAQRAAGEGRGGSYGARLDGATRGGGRISAVVDVPVPAAPYVRFSGWMRTEGLVRGASDASGAGLVVVARDAAGTMHWEDPHTVAFVTSDRTWCRHVKGFEVPSYATSIAVIAFNRADAGTMVLDDLRLEPATLKTGFSTVKVLLGAVWVVLLGLNVVALGLLSSTVGRWTTLCIVLIAVGVALPGGLYRQVLHAQARWVRHAKTIGNTIVPGPSTQNAEVSATESERLGRDVKQAKALGHAALFTVLGLLAALVPRARGRRVTALAYLILYATATEALQFVVSRRQALVDDLLLDAAAAAVGLVVASAIAAIGRRRARAEPAPGI